MLDRAGGGERKRGHAQHASVDGIEALRLDVDDHEVRCGVHVFSIAARTDKNAKLIGALLFTVRTADIGRRRTADWTVGGIASRFSGPVDCYRIITRDLSDLPLPTFVTSNTRRRSDWISTDRGIEKVKSACLQ